MQTLIGTKVDSVIATASHIPEGRGFKVGTRVTTHDGKSYIYAQSASAIAQYNVVAVNLSTGIAAALSTTTAPAAEAIGVAQIAIASGEYGWVQTYGRGKVKVLGACVKNINLWTTATAGSLDDATASTYMVMGINLLSTNPSATATALSAFIVNPSILLRAGTA